MSDEPHTPQYQVTKEAVDKVTRALMDEGKIIEAGWRGFEMLVVDKDAPDVQRTDMRLAFFAGAQHLFSSIMSALEPDSEPTDNDMRRMDFINKELEGFAERFKKERVHNA